MEGEYQTWSKFPPGFRFHPSDEELINYYLKNKITSRPLPALIIAEIDLYKYNPWELPSLFFFTILSLYLLTILKMTHFLYVAIARKNMKVKIFCFDMCRKGIVWGG